MASPSDMEKELIKMFRENMGDALRSEEEKSDPFLLRWIRARDHNLDKAEEMLKNSLQWRETSGADKILTTPYDPWFATSFPYWVDGLDKTGHPVIEIPLGAWDVRRAMNPEREPQWEGQICRFFEDILRMIRESNNDTNHKDWPNTLCNIIVDWKGYSYSQLIHWKALQNTLKMAATYEAHYPEILHKVYFINCPAIFPLFMALLKPIIAPKTLGKITCFSGEEEWGPAFRADIDQDQLGHLYGGRRIMTVGDDVYNYDT